MYRYGFMDMRGLTQELTQGSLCGRAYISDFLPRPTFHVGHGLEKGIDVSASSE